MAGTFNAPDQPLPGSFVANWWARGVRGLLKASTSVPEGLIGEAQLGLRTNADSELGRLIGGSSLSFAVLQRFNTFPYTRTELSIVAHGKDRRTHEHGGFGRRVGIARSIHGAGTHHRRSADPERLNSGGGI